VAAQCTGDEGALPFVSVLMPIRNEASYIRQSLGSVLAQDYPGQRMEILVLDAMSTDGTRSIVSQMAAQQTSFQVHIVDNPRGIVSSALNIGVRRGKGDVYIRVDGHCEIPPDYVRSCVKLLESTGAANVGGRQCPVGESFVARAIALATSFPFGIGNARYRYSGELGYVDTVYLGAYPREVFERIGGFDERLVRHQDYEFNLRLRQSGGKIFYAPTIEVRYYSRASLLDLVRQYFEYGFWKGQVTKQNPQAFALRHAAPVVLVLAMLVGALLSLLVPWVRVPYLGMWLLYLGAGILAAGFVAARGDWRYLPLLPLVFAAIHLSWGLGFWWGVIRPSVLGTSDVDC
jgi:succinoglycan biosynthesis protein ExoA